EHGGALEVDRGGHGVRVAAGSGVGLALGQLGVDRGGGGGGAGGGRRGIVRVDARGARAPARAHGRVGVELVVERGRAVGHLAAGAIHAVIEIDADGGRLGATNG